MEDTDHPVDPFVKPTHQHYLLTENATPTKPTEPPYNGTYVRFDPRLIPPTPTARIVNNQTPPNPNTT